MLGQILVASFYKYAVIECPDSLKKEQIELCTSLNLKGRILIGNEGINGSISGTMDEVRKFQEILLKDILFHGMDFKEQAAEKHAFNRLYISIRKEVVHFGTDAKLGNKADYIQPEQLNELIEGDHDIILLDVRNNYETRIGKFKNAITLDIRNFRDFPKAVSNLAYLKEKRIVTYCTGGIRCEKASAYLKEQNFKNVLQLQGGILNYGKSFPHGYFEGECFVFDDRLSIPLGKESEPLNECVWCKVKTGKYINCHNIDCDLLFVCCENCLHERNASCSGKCAASQRRRIKNMIHN